MRSIDAKFIMNMEHTLRWQCPSLNCYSLDRYFNKFGRRGIRGLFTPVGSLIQEEVERNDE